MSRLGKSLLAAGLAFTAVTAWWWGWAGGQYWMAVHTGTDYCQVPPSLLRTCRAYGFWSGFGSVIPWALFSMGGILTGLLVALRHINCHETGCPWIGRFPAAGGAFRYCGRHHPGWDGKHPSAEHQVRMHALRMKQLGHPDYQDDQAKPV